VKEGISVLLLLCLLLASCTLVQTPDSLAVQGPDEGQKPDLSPDTASPSGSEAATDSPASQSKPGHDFPSFVLDGSGSNVPRFISRRSELPRDLLLKSNPAVLILCFGDTAGGAGVAQYLIDSGLLEAWEERGIHCYWFSPDLGAWLAQIRSRKVHGVSMLLDPRGVADEALGVRRWPAVIVVGVTEGEGGEPSILCRFEGWDDEAAEQLAGWMKEEGLNLPREARLPPKRRKPRLEAFKGPILVTAGGTRVEAFSNWNKSRDYTLPGCVILVSPEKPSSVQMAAQLARSLDGQFAETLNIVTIFLGEEEEARSLLGGLPGRVFLDPQGRIADSLHLDVCPTLLLATRRLGIHWLVEGEAAARSETVEKAVHDLRSMAEGLAQSRPGSAAPSVELESGARFPDDLADDYLLLSFYQPG